MSVSDRPYWQQEKKKITEKVSQKLSFRETGHFKSIVKHPHVLDQFTAPDGYKQNLGKNIGRYEMINQPKVPENTPYGSLYFNHIHDSTLVLFCFQTKVKKKTQKCF